MNITDLQTKAEELNANLAVYDAIGAPLVEEYIKELDEKVAGVQNYMSQCKEFNLEFDVGSLQRILVDLSTTIYWANERYEKLGLLEDLAKINYKTKYSEAYLEKQGKTTVADKKFTVEQLRAYAESEAIEENVLNFVYSHAASAIKSKIDSANELLKATSKILSSKIQEMSTFGVGGKY